MYEKLINSKTTIETDGMFANHPVNIGTWMVSERDGGNKNWFNFDLEFQWIYYMHFADFYNQTNHKDEQVRNKFSPKWWCTIKLHLGEQI